MNGEKKVKRGIRLLGLLYRKALALRYTVRLEGTEVLQGNETLLILPNHQATVDPQILFAHLYRFTTAVPLVSAGYTDIGILKPLFNYMGVIPVPDLERGRKGVELVAQLHDVVLDALNRQKNILIYPAGQLAGQGDERIYNKQTAWQVCCQLPENTRVIGVRIRGLWGSIWSRAWTGRSPNFVVTYLRGIGYVLANLIFFLPRRKVSVSFHDITAEALNKAGEGRQAFNHYLETFYNAPGTDPLLFLKHFFYFPRSGPFSWRVG